MEKISLFYMSKVSLGGFVSYTSHLCKALRIMGYDANVYKIRKTTERKLREFNDGIMSQNVNMETAAQIIKESDYAIVTATFWRGWNEDISKLIELGCEVVIHDHTDYGENFRDFMLRYGVQPIVIRKKSYENLRSKGLEAVYIPHPYVPVNPQPVKRDMHAASICRLDFDKHTDIIVAANEKLPAKKRIHIWGAHTRLYMFRHIVGKYKGWDDSKHYTGPMYPLEQQRFPRTPGFAVGLNNRANFTVDMSAIKDDGGGTQYSFLEAIDGGAILVLNSKWFIDGKQEMVRDRNCLGVSSTKELVELLSTGERIEYRDVVQEAYCILEKHSPQIVVPRLMKFLRGK